MDNIVCGEAGTRTKNSVVAIIRNIKIETILLFQLLNFLSPYLPYRMHSSPLERKMHSVTPFT
ncbi:hypothetical protein DRO54_00310 [Candidatus Bathyarchaeota archaeon]|nr:MAG: hypothetical protein DRO54_00310 [Candidatus Bathyarchaeota archaeon]